jgi:ABC-type enterobactin transport system permease subunit
MTQDERDLHRVHRARYVARLMRRLGWVSLVLGVLALLGIVALLVMGEMSLEQAFLAATGTALVTMMSGASSYGSSMNLTLNASRLERDLRKATPPAKHE